MPSTLVLFSGVDASTNQTSASKQFLKRTEWFLQVTQTGLDGTPRLFIEYSSDGDTPSVWIPIQNPETCLNYFDIDQDIKVMDDRLQAFHYRIRLEPNDNTTGTVTAKLGWKDYP